MGKIGKFFWGVAVLAIYVIVVLYMWSCMFLDYMAAPLEKRFKSSK